MVQTKNEQSQTRLKRAQFRAGFFASAGALASPPTTGVWPGPASGPPSLPPLLPDLLLALEPLPLLPLFLPDCPCHSLPPTAMPGRHYSKFIPPSLAMSELVCQKLDNDATDMLIDKWLERPHRPDSYHDWFQRVRERKHLANASSRRDQILLWNKGVFVPENIFTRTIDTGRLIPLDRTWVTHVYHHRSMKRLTMMPVIFSMVSPSSFFRPPLPLTRSFTKAP